MTGIGVGEAPGSSSQNTGAPSGPSGSNAPSSSGSQTQEGPAYHREAVEVTQM